MDLVFKYKNYIFSLRNTLLRNMFINRHDELSYLQQKYAGNKPELIIIYGRRRTGKTTLIKRFLEGKQGVYLIVSKLGKEALIDFAGMIQDQLSLDYKPSFQDYRDLYNYIMSKSKEKRFVLVIDEFQRLAEDDPSFLMQLQEVWDQKSSNSMALIILVGSAVGVIERIGLSSSSPIYGRRTGQIKLKPMSFSCASQFLKDYGDEDKVRGYSVFGGIPAYLTLISQDKTLMENISNLILDRKGPLYEEPYNLLSEETREPLRYMAILEAMSHGATTLGEISDKSGISASNIPKYIKTLEKDLDMTVRYAPLLEEKKRGKYRYYIKDHFLNFWFKYVKPNIYLLEMEEKDRVVEKIRNEIDIHSSKAFEDICREHITRKLKLTKIGKWWHQNVEIDCIGIDERENKAYFMEAKWKSTPVSREVLNKLIRKAEEFKWRNDKRKEIYILYSRKGFKFTEEENIILYDLNKLMNELRCKQPINRAKVNKRNP